jgi:uncharacterized protein DUF1801
MRTAATSVAGYLAELSPERRKAISAVRNVIRKNLPKGYTEAVNFGMINYAVPLSRLPSTYNGQPLCYAALAAQKNYCAVYLMRVYGDPKQAAWLKGEFRKAGKKLDMGKSCIRFRTAEDLPLDAIGSVIASTPMEQYVEIYEQSRKR